MIELRIEEARRVSCRRFLEENGRASRARERPHLVPFIWNTPPPSEAVSMSRSLAALADPVQRLKICPLIDSAELFFPTLNREQQRILGRIGVVKPCCRCWGSYRLIVTRPS